MINTEQRIVVFDTFKKNSNPLSKKKIVKCKQKRRHAKKKKRKRKTDKEQSLLVIFLVWFFPGDKTKKNDSGPNN